MRFNYWALSLFILPVASICFASSYRKRGTVIKVKGANLLTIKTSAGESDFRLWMIDRPESEEAREKAQDYLQKKCLKETVWVEMIGEKVNGVQPALVTVIKEKVVSQDGPTDISVVGVLNYMLIKNGLSKMVGEEYKGIWKKSSFEKLKSLETSAKSKALGVWANKPTKKKSPPQNKP